MTYSSYTVAKTVCFLSGDSLTSLELHKILYLLHMYHLGRLGKPLIAKEAFEAWKYSPTLPKIHKRIFNFGSSTIPHNIFYKDELIPKEDSEAYKTIREILTKLMKIPLSKLSSLVRHPNGAWKKHYKKGAMNIQIPDEEIKQEYKLVFKKK